MTGVAADMVGCARPVDAGRRTAKGHSAIRAPPAKPVVGGSFGGCRSGAAGRVQTAVTVVTPVIFSEPQAAQAAHPAELLSERPQQAHLRLLGALGGRADRLVGGGEDHVLEELDVVGIDRLGVDDDLLDLHRAADLHGHHAPARRGLDDLVAKLLLHLLLLALHLLHLAHELLLLTLGRGHGQSLSSSAGISSASNSATKRRTNSSGSVAAAGAPSPPAGAGASSRT